MLAQYNVDLDDYIKKEKIGNGQFGTVYIVENKKTRKELVAKVSKMKIVSTEEKKQFFQELTVFSKVKNPAVVSLEGFNMGNFEKESFPTILLPYMRRGSLDKLIEKHTISSSKKYIILLGIAEGMKYLHSQKIIHRDLKPANIFLDENFYPHIGDFGESKVASLDLSDMLMETFVGSPAFMAPEILSQKPYTYKVDIYSYAILMYNIITNEKPFLGYSPFFRFQKGKRPDLKFIEDEAIKNLLNRCWSANPDERPDFSQIVEELKDERILKSMKADYNEVNNYLRLFNDKLFEKRSDSCDGSFLVDYANKLYYGNGITFNKTEAARYFKIAADKGNINAMVSYANMLFKGDGIAVNKTEAAQYFKVAADKGKINAMISYANMLFKGDGIDVNKTEAARYFKMAADKGNIDGISSYGYMLYYGLGIAVNKTEAAQYFKLAADNGHTVSMVNYSRMLIEGDGIEANFAKAILYAKMAADNGDIKAMTMYASLLRKINGIAVNQEEAVKYYKMAADMGNIDAEISYYAMLCKGKGITRNIEKPINYCKTLYEKGDIPSIFRFLHEVAFY